MTELSLYEQVSDISTIKKQWFFDLFQGDALDTDRWSLVDIAGTGSGAMNDSINGGYNITSGTTAQNNTVISFNDAQRPFDNDNCVYIGVTKADVVTGASNINGLTNNDDRTANSDYCYVENNSGQSFYRLINGDGTTNAVETTLVNDTNWHTHKIVLSASNSVLSIDGVQEATNSLDLPLLKQQPFVHARCITAGTAGSHNVRYIEVYNT